MAGEVNRFLIDDVHRLLHGTGRLLDIPAGTGDLSRTLVEAGYTVTSADLFPEYYRYAEGDVVRADMNERLPFEDDAFDGIICREGVEHLENLGSFFRECSRVLHDGGYLWLTTPNFMDLSGRLSYFLTGMKSFHAGFPNEETTVWGSQDDRLYHGHAFSLPFFQVRYLLRVSQFDDIVLHGLKRSMASTLIYAVVRPLSGLLIARALRRLRRKKCEGIRSHATTPALSDKLVTLALSRDLLLNRKICVRAALREGSFVPVSGL